MCDESGYILPAICNLVPIPLGDETPIPILPNELMVNALNNQEASQNKQNNPLTTPVQNGGGG